MVVFAELTAYPLTMLFVGYDGNLASLTLGGFRIFSIAFVFMGFAIFASGFFTALNDGVTSAIISFLRTAVFQVLAVMLLPLILGVAGIWTSVIVAEFMAVALSVAFLFAKRKRFGY
jgi:Na+-driven multidrug efflux pump